MLSTSLLLPPVSLWHITNTNTKIMSYLLCDVRTAYVIPFWMHYHNQGTLHIETTIQKIPTDIVPDQSFLTVLAQGRDSQKKVQYARWKI